MVKTIKILNNWFNSNTLSMIYKMLNTMFKKKMYLWVSPTNMFYLLKYLQSKEKFYGYDFLMF